MSELRFTVPGDPRSKGRPRFVNGRAITPPETRRYERFVGFCAAGAIVSSGLKWPTHDTAYAVTASVTRPDNRRQDLDNIIKVLLDGMNGIVWHDDSQVREIHAYFCVPDKHRPRVDITVSVL